MKATDTQVGGEHYKNMKIQPIDFILQNNIGHCEASAINYLVRWKDKNGVEDLEKAKQYIDFLIDGALEKCSTFQGDHLQEQNK